MLIPASTSRSLADGADWASWAQALLTPAVSSLTVSPPAALLSPGGTQALTASVVSNTTTPVTVSWASSNTAVATVDASTGVVTAVAAGNAIITATTSAVGVNGAALTNTTFIRVVTPAVTELTVSPSTLSLAIGGGTTTGTLTASKRFDTGADSSLTWSSSNTAVATVSSSGVVTAVGAGAAIITVSAANGGFAATSVVSVTGAGGAVAPAAPTLSSALSVGAVGTGRLTVAWTAPLWTGGSAITGYIASASPVNGGGTTTCSASASARTCNITGLVNGAAYAVTVQATNAIGTSAASSPAATLTPCMAPSAPTGVTAALYGPRSLRVSWTPASDGGCTVTSFTASTTVSSSVYSCTTTGAASAAPAFCVVTGLPTNSNPTFTVVATNAAGVSAASAASSSVTVYDVPTVPQSVAATPNGNGTLAISWTAPSSDGGVAVSRYDVSATTTSVGAANGTCSTTGSLSCSISGLANGVSYTVSVTAGQSIGNSAAATLVAMPQTVPTAPLGVTSVAGSTLDGFAIVSWSPPAINGGRNVTGYAVSAWFTGFGGSGLLGCTSAGSTPVLSCAVPGLPRGVPVTFTVKARNVAGWGPASAASPALTLAGSGPGAPWSPAAVARNDSTVLVTWAPPRSNGGSAVVNYTVTAVPSGIVCSASAPGPLCCVFTGLSSSADTAFTVTSSSSAGVSVSSGVSAAVRPATGASSSDLSNPRAAQCSTAGAVGSATFASTSSVAVTSVVAGTPGASDPGVMLVLGTANMAGTSRVRQWVNLASTASAGATSLTLSSPVNAGSAGSALGAGDVIVLAYASTPADTALASAVETATIASVSGNGLTMTLTSPLASAHYVGAYTADSNSASYGAVLTSAIGLLSQTVTVKGGHVLVTSAQRASANNTGVLTATNVLFDSLGPVTGSAGSVDVCIGSSGSSSSASTVSASSFVNAVDAVAVSTCSGNTVAPFTNDTVVYIPSQNNAYYLTVGATVPSATPSASAAGTAAATATPTGSSQATPSATGTATATATPTGSSQATSSATGTAQPSVSIGASASPTRTAASTGSATPTATSTATATKEACSASSFRKLPYTDIDGDVITVLTSASTLADCQLSCCAQAGCTSYTMSRVNGQCFLMANSTYYAPGHHFDSGVLGNSS